MKFEIWLDDNFSHFNRGLVTTDDGEVYEVKSWLTRDQSGACKCLISDHPRDAVNFLIEWIVKPQCIDICRWDKAVESILFHNGSNKAVGVKGRMFLSSDGKISRSESPELFEEDLEYENLLNMHILYDIFRPDGEDR